ARCLNPVTDVVPSCSSAFTYRPPTIHYLFFLHDPPPTEIYTLSLHDALPIWCTAASFHPSRSASRKALTAKPARSIARRTRPRRSEETRLNSSHVSISYAVFCLKKKKNIRCTTDTLCHRCTDGLSTRSTTVPS